MITRTGWFLIGGLAFLVLLFFALAITFDNLDKREERCEPYADTPQKDIPGNCISYWENR